ELAVDDRQGCRGLIGPRIQTHHSERILNVVAYRRWHPKTGHHPRRTSVICCDQHVFTYSQTVKAGIELEHSRQSGVAAPYRRQPGDVTPFQRYATGTDTSLSRDHLEECSFSGSIRPTDAQNLAASKVKAQVADSN